MGSQLRKHTSTHTQRSHISKLYNKNSMYNANTRYAYIDITLDTYEYEINKMYQK